MSAALGRHAALPGLPQRPPAAFLLDGDGVLLLADCAIINLANLSSFEFISLCASCKMETCSVNCMIVDIWDVTVCVSEVLALVACFAVAVIVVCAA